MSAAGVTGGVRAARPAAGFVRRPCRAGLHADVSSVPVALPFREGGCGVRARSAIAGRADNWTLVRPFLRVWGAFRASAGQDAGSCFADVTGRFLARDPADRRRYRISLTMKGRNAFTTAQKVVRETERTTLQPLTAAERATLHQLATKIHAQSLKS